MFVQMRLVSRRPAENNIPSVAVTQIYIKKEIKLLWILYKVTDYYLRIS